MYRYRFRGVKFLFSNPEINRMAVNYVSKRGIFSIIREYVEGNDEILPESLRSRDVKILTIYLYLSKELAEEEKKKLLRIKYLIENKFYVDDIFLKGITLSEWERTRVFLTFLYAYFLKEMKTEVGLFFSEKFLKEFEGKTPEKIVEETMPVAKELEMEDVCRFFSMEFSFELNRENEESKEKKNVVKLTETKEEPAVSEPVEEKSSKLETPLKKEEWGKRQDTDEEEENPLEIVRKVLGSKNNT